MCSEEALIEWPGRKRTYERPWEEMLQRVNAIGNSEQSAVDLGISLGLEGAVCLPEPAAKTEKRA